MGGGQNFQNYDVFLGGCHWSYDIFRHVEGGVKKPGTKSDKKEVNIWTIHQKKYAEDNDLAHFFGDWKKKSEINPPLVLSKEIVRAKRKKEKDWFCVNFYSR